MIYLKTDEEVELMRQSNRLLGMAYGEIAKAIAPGVTTAQLNKIGEEFVRDNGGIPSCLGYEGFPAAFCSAVFRGLRALLMLLLLSVCDP